MTSKLFEPMKLRGLTIRNRIFLPPMCQYSVVTEDGIPTEWHLMHYGARAAGGFGLIMVEAAGVSPEARISPRCVGIWNETQSLAWEPIVDFVHSQGAAIGIQLAHAGRKASTEPSLPGFNGGSVAVGDGGWSTVAPSAVPFPKLAEPRELSVEEIKEVVSDFSRAAQRAVKCGFDTVEIHAAHGYLLHQFLSPISNKRTDEYGGNFANRIRIVVETVEAVRKVIPESMPLIIRISATDWVDGEESWDVDSSIRLLKELEILGVDAVDVSSGGLIPAPIEVGPGYQAGLAKQIAKEIDMPVIAVGKIDTPELAEHLVAFDGLDAVDVGSRALLDPAWPAKAANVLGLDPVEAGLAPQYHRGRA